VPESTVELTKNTPVPPPPTVLLYNLVIADAVGVEALLLNVKILLIVILPVPLAVKVKLLLLESDVIDVMLIKSLFKLIVAVSGSDTAVLILLPPAIFKVSPLCYTTADESSPTMLRSNEVTAANSVST
jgi:hypothetical protein